MTTSVRATAIGCMLWFALGLASVQAESPTPADSTEKPTDASVSFFVAESEAEEVEDGTSIRVRNMGTSPKMWHEPRSWDPTHSWDRDGCWIESSMWDRMEAWEDCSACLPMHMSPPKPCRWTATADAIFLQRTTARAQPILFIPVAGPPATNVIALDVDDLAFSFQAGPRVSFARRLNNESSIEVNYFGLYGASASAVRNGNPGILFPPGPFISTQFAVDYLSELSSVELNYRHRYKDRIEFFIGVRWLELTEQFEVVAPEVVGIPTPTYEMRTGNPMFGFQLGANAKLYERGKRFRVDGVMKAGVFANDPYQRTSSIDNLGRIVTADDDKDNTAFVGEIGLTATYRFNNRWAARFGYQAMWIDGVALAPDQIPSTDVIPPVGALPGAVSVGTANLGTNRGVFYHGCHVGFEVKW